jgi:uncharacterized protein YfaT (DUF1175 family)
MPMQISECQAMNGFIYWGYFSKINFMFPKFDVAWLKIKGIMKREIGNSIQLNARLHMIIEKGHKGEYKVYGPYLEACIFIVDQEQAFEAELQMKVNCR